MRGFQIQLGSPDALPVSVVMSPQQSVLMLLRQVASGQAGGWPGPSSAAAGRALRPAARFATRSFAVRRPTITPECCAPISPLADVPVAEQASRLRDLPPDVLTGQLHAGHGGKPYPPQWRDAAEQPCRWLASMADASLDTWAAIAPRWKAAAPLFAREVERVGTAAVRGGMDALLNSLHPRISYADGVLTFAYPNNRRVALGGRRLALLPMIAGRDAVGISAERPEICYIAYPVRPPGPHPRAGASHALALILGPLRAAALQALGRPLTVGEVAAAVQCAPTTATYHLQQMAKADLITRQRHGTSVHISRTLRGDRLVDLLSLTAPGMPRATAAWPGGQGAPVRSSECPAASRGHCGIGRPSGHAATGGQSGAPAAVRVLEHRCGQPGGESSQASWRPYTVRSMSA
jgi:DNA-binding transcriptional ArsR family regulator